MEPKLLLVKHAAPHSDAPSQNADYVLRVISQRVHSHFVLHPLWDLISCPHDFSVSSLDRIRPIFALHTIAFIYA